MKVVVLLLEGITITMSAGNLNFVHRFKPMEQPTLKINGAEIVKGAEPGEVPASK